MLVIRPAAVSDVPLLLRFSRELAEYERQADAVVINEEALVRDGFGSQPKFRSLMAEWDGEAIGYALFFGIYSSVKGSGMFLEDVFVREAFRGRGIGRALLSAVARIAREEGSYGIRWEVLDWNESAIKSKYTLAQVDQGVWGMLGANLRLYELLFGPPVPLTSRLDCIRSMYHVYSDYVSKLEREPDPEIETGFYMWWDLILPRLLGFVSTHVARRCIQTGLGITRSARCAI